MNWDGRYVLCPIDDRDRSYYYVYKDSDSPDDITDADNYFSTQPARVPKGQYSARRVAPQEEWKVFLANGTMTWMAVFVLRRNA
jgi:hypothetical protein